MAYPTAKNASAPAMKSMRFFIMMFATLLARVSPASTSANPACMKITSTAAINTNALSRSPLTTSAVRLSAANAGVAP